jgi:hypothetical protein
MLHTKEVVTLNSHCKKGHEFTEENTWYRIVNGKKRRVCRACSNERVKRWYERHPGKRRQRRELTINELMSQTVKDPMNGCWLWQGELTRGGYARFCRKAVQRVLYEHFCGPIPATFETHHICSNKHCVNPGHLLAVNRREHQQFDNRLLYLDRPTPRPPLKTACPYWRHESRKPSKSWRSQSWIIFGRDFETSWLISHFGRRRLSNQLRLDHDLNLLA